MIAVQRIIKLDKWLKLYGSKILAGAIDTVLRFAPRPRVLVEYKVETIMTMLWNLVKLLDVAEGAQPLLGNKIPLSGEGAGGEG
ncbi:MAG: hypothetical protein NTZ34_03290 [Chloroflexi bacterium]|nr:hypothetical protein [Chloroflexota bacterium]